MPDTWEMLHGTDPLVADGTADADGDGLSNYAEWLAGTDPQDAGSLLKFDAIRWDAGPIRLEFTARANRSYTVLSAPDAEATIWVKTAEVPAAPADRQFTFEQPLAERTFYRLVTPAQR